ncbi:uncharacterized protein LOC119684893 isoform X2 [Teleopsis dalmanni]|uniref:uncharacterized protein LOC119684893 isoform X2 n=1 Tax=Teleopsis dalmanni TaxID=139649 RepID=UPI0018CD0ED6|nr:uncharacterized protein LOC119684893 isoform X2 [Teleopsis dalmanni]
MPPNHFLKYSCPSSSSIDSDAYEIIDLRRRMTRNWLNDQPSTYSPDTDVENFTKRWSKFSSRLSKMTKKKEHERKKYPDVKNKAMRNPHIPKRGVNLRSNFLNEPVIELPDDSGDDEAKAVPALKFSSAHMYINQIPDLQLSPKTQNIYNAKVHFPHKQYHRNCRNKIPEQKLCSSVKNPCDYKKQIPCAKQQSNWDQLPWREVMLEKERMKRQVDNTPVLEIQTSAKTIYERRVMDNKPIKTSKEEACTYKIPLEGLYFNDKFDSNRDTEVEYELQDKAAKKKQKFNRIYNNPDKYKNKPTRVVQNEDLHIDSNDEEKFVNYQLRMRQKDSLELNRLKQMQKHLPKNVNKPRKCEEIEENAFEDEECPVAKAIRKKKVTGTQIHLSPNQQHNLKTLHEMMKKIASRKKRSRNEKQIQQEKFNTCCDSKEHFYSKNKNTEKKSNNRQKKEILCKNCSQEYIDNVLDREEEELKAHYLQNECIHPKDSQSEESDTSNEIYEYSPDELIKERAKTQKLLREEDSCFRKILIQHLIRKGKLQRRLRKIDGNKASKSVQTDEFAFLKYLNENGFK